MTLQPTHLLATDLDGTFVGDEQATAALLKYYDELPYDVTLVYGIEANVLVAGDSGNDIEMITCGYPAVIVGNAQQELRDVMAHARIFRASRHCAGGIHEAWEHFYGTREKVANK